MSSHTRRLEEKDKAKILGRKRISELGRDGVKKTKAAYKERFKDGINAFGQNRGLQLEQIILRDDDGERMIVNGERPHTFSNLTKGEKRRVDRTLRWKDLHRISDQTYASIKKTNGLPAASHIKQQERQLNERVSKIHQVLYQFVYTIMF